MPKIKTITTWVGWEEKYIYWGWGPWANTIAYYPFKEDQLDKVWSSSIGITWTKETLWYTFSSTWSIDINTPPSSCRFISVWIKWNSNQWQYVQTPCTYIWNILYNYYNNNGSTYNKRFQHSVWSSSWSTRWSWSPNTWEWHHLAMWFDGTKCFAYVDGTLVWSYNTTSVYTPWWMRLGYMINETVSEFICESVCWTTDEILAYYNNTKSKYL